MITIRLQKIGIPEIDKDRLQVLLRQIEPVVEFDGVLHYVRWSDPVSTSYLWGAKQAGRADEMSTIGYIRTYHSYGCPSFFKPSVDEVLAQVAQLDPEIVAKIVAFEIVQRPLSADDLNIEHRALNAGYHVATVRLYGKPGEKEVYDLQAADRSIEVG